MSKISKIVVYIIVAVLLLGQLGFWVTFADNENTLPAVCKQTPYELQTYINFQVEMIWALWQIWQKQEKLTGYKKKWLFSYGTLKAWTNLWQSMVRFANNLLQPAVDAARAVELSTVMAEKIVEWSVSDSMWSLSIILFRWEPYVRDWKKLQDIDNSLSDLVYDVIMNWYWSSKIDDDVMADLLELQQKYYAGSENSMFSSFVMSPDVKYKEVIRKLFRMNNGMKWFLSLWSWAYDWDTWNSDFNVVFNEKFLESLFNEYENSVKCNEFLTPDFWKILQWWDFVKNTENSRKMVEDADERLKQAWKNAWEVVKHKFWDTDSVLTEDQKELLSSVYGIDAKSLSKSQKEALSQMLNEVVWWYVSPSRWDPVISRGKKLLEYAEAVWTSVSAVWDLAYWSAKSLWSWVKKVISGSSSSVESIDVSKLKIYMPEKEQNQYTWLVDNLNTSISVMLSDLEADQEMIVSVDSKNTNRYFVEIWSYIHSWVNQTIGTKDEQSSIVYLLWRVCEYQCANKWWRCYY